MRTTDHLVLGTASWGDRVDVQEAFMMLDVFAGANGTWIDTATNYPIDSNSSHFGLAQTWLAEWVRRNRGNKLRVYSKFGSLTNDGSPNTNLTPSFLEVCLEIASGHFLESMGGFGIHWDSRSKKSEIEKTALFLFEKSSQGWLVGGSGIQNLATYARVFGPEIGRFHYQIRCNFLNFEAATEIKKLFPGIEIWGYGLNFGNLRRAGPAGAQKLGQVVGFLESRLPLVGIETVAELNFARSFFDQNLDRVVIGPRSVAQLKKTLALDTSLLSLASHDIQFVSSEIRKIEERIKSVTE